MPIEKTSPAANQRSSAFLVLMGCALVIPLVASTCLAAGFEGIGEAPSSVIEPAAASANTPLPGPFPLFPASNWWNQDISAAPVDTSSAAFITFIGATKSLHPDFGGDVSPGSDQGYGFPYIVVDKTQTRLAVDFPPSYRPECDGVNPTTLVSFPFYPIPPAAATTAHWVEGGDKGNVDRRASEDRHILVVDRDQKFLYELWNCWYDGTKWQCGSGAFFDMNASDRRPETWTSADAAGLAILPGLVRYDEAFGTEEIGHAFRVTLRAANGFVWPASHEAGTTTGALPMGARLRLKATKDISTFTSEVQRIFRAMKKYGLIMADNGTDLYISGTYDNRWDNGILNPAFGALKASDFEVIQRGWPPENLRRDRSVTSLYPVTPALSTILPLNSLDNYIAPVHTEDNDPQAVLTDNAHPLIFYDLDGPAELHLRKSGSTVKIVF